MKSIVLGSVLGATLLLLNGCGSDDAATETIADLAVGDKNLSTLVKALVTADLVSTFNDTNSSFTVFAPTDEAFDTVPNLTCLLDAVNGPILEDLLKYHAVAGESLAKDLSNGAKLKTLDDDKILNVTIDGGNVTVNNAGVTQADILASNGVIHVIDNVLIPDGFAQRYCSYEGKDAVSIADLAKTYPSFSKLVSAVDAAGLADTFNGTGRDIFTFFAPTNEAFEATASDQSLPCLQDPKSIALTDLSALLKHHVLGTYALSSDLSDGEVFTALDGTKLTVATKDGITVGGAVVTDPDNYATNGVVHQIDQVLVPDDWKCPPTTTSGAPLVLV